jgi:hypothetical protein
MSAAILFFQRHAVAGLVPEPDARDGEALTAKLRSDRLGRSQEAGYRDCAVCGFWPLSLDPPLRLDTLILCPACTERDIDHPAARAAVMAEFHRTDTGALDLYCRATRVSVFRRTDDHYGLRLEDCRRPHVTYIGKASFINEARAANKARRTCFTLACSGWETTGVLPAEMAPEFTEMRALEFDRRFRVLRGAVGRRS